MKNPSSSRMSRMLAAGATRMALMPTVAIYEFQEIYRLVMLKKSQRFMYCVICLRDDVRVGMKCDEFRTF